MRRIFTVNSKYVYSVGSLEDNFQIGRAAIGYVDTVPQRVLETMLKGRVFYLSFIQYKFIYASALTSVPPRKIRCERGWTCAGDIKKHVHPVRDSKHD